MDQTSVKQRIVVDEHDMEAWPAITRENHPATAATDNELKSTGSNSTLNPAATAAASANIPVASLGQGSDLSHMTTGSGTKGSIWSTPPAGWGSITLSSKESMPFQQQGLFGSKLNSSAGNSVWGSSTQSTGAKNMESSKEPRSSGWNSGNGSMTVDDTNRMDTQPPIQPPSTQSQVDRMQTESPHPTSVTPTSAPGWGANKEQPGANNSAVGSSGSSWTAASTNTLSSTTSWVSSSNNSTPGTSGWGSAPPKTTTTGWGDMPNTTSSAMPPTRWGTAAIPPSTSNTPGWGSKLNSSQQTSSSESAVTPGWGDSNATPGSQWGRAGGQPTSQTPTSSVGPSGWATLPSPAPSAGPATAGWGSHSTLPNDVPEARFSRQQSASTGWGGGDIRRSESGTSGWGSSSGSSWDSNSKAESKFSSIDTNAEGWGKKPINQDTQWEGVGQKVAKTMDNGTAAWGESQATPMTPSWGSNPPPPSAWGKPRMPSEVPQPVAPPTPQPVQSAWGSDRKPAWGPPPGRSESSVGMSGSGMRGSGMEGRMEGSMGMRGMIGNSAVGSSGGIGLGGNMGMAGSNSMGSASASQWCQPSGPIERRDSSSQGRPSGWGNPPGGMAPGGSNTHSQSDGSSWGTWSNDDANPPQDGPPPSRMPEKLSGWSDLSDIPTTIVAIGWGGPSPPPNRKIPVDDGTFVWGNSTEHNARIEAQSRRNLTRMATVLNQDAHSTMQTPPPGTLAESGDGTAVPPSPVASNAPEGSTNPVSKPDTATSASWGEADQDQKPTGWGDSAKVTEDGWNRNGGSKPGTGGSKWDEPATPWVGSTNGGSTQDKDSMQPGWNDGPGGNVSNMGHWGDDDWDTKSQSSESSLSNSNMKPRKPINRGTNGMSNIGQKESTHWISKLKRLMDQGYTQEEAEMALRKHNMNFDTALMELRQTVDTKSGDFDAHLRQVNRDMGSLMLGNNLPDGPKAFGMGDGPFPPPSPISNHNMMNNPSGPKPGFGNVGRSGFMPTQPLQQQQQQQQRFSGSMQQQQGFTPPFAPANQPIRGPFNPQMMQQQQQQQQQQQHHQVQAILQMAVQAGLINNQNLLRNPLTQQQVMQLFQLQQQQQQSVPGKMQNMRQQQELMQHLITMQQQLSQHGGPVQRGMPRPPFPLRSKLHSDSEVFPNSEGVIHSADFGVKEPQQSRLSQFFAQRQSLSSTGGKPASDLFPSANRNDSMASVSDVSSRSDGWSRSNSPTQSDSLPHSADSTFSDSGWSFHNSNSDIDLLEFKPGVPWKPRTKDVANDPHATPGSVNNDLLNSSSLTVGGSSRTNRIDRSSRDDISGILIKPMKPPPPNTNWSGNSSSNPNFKKSSWNYQDQFSQQPSSAPNWNVPSSNQRPPRPPPGLADQPRNAGWPASSSHNVPAGRSWDRSISTSGLWSGSDGPTNWLVLRNLTPQIDGSTLRLLCLQHGPLEHFHMNLSQGTAIIAYRTRDEAIKAQRSLNTCVLSNTTIIADFATSADIARSRDRSQSQSGASGVAKFPSTVGSNPGGLSGISSFGIKDESRIGSGGTGQWNGATTSSLPGLSGNPMWSSNTPTTTSTPWSGGETDATAVGVPPSLSFLPGDLLGEGAM